jgi:hypothetical protein
MPLIVLMRLGDLGQGDELVAHVDEGLAFAFAAQAEIENGAVEGQRFLDIADLQRHMVHPDQAGLLSCRFGGLGHHLAPLFPQ